VSPQYWRDNEGCDSEGGRDEGVASVEYHDNRWASVDGNIASGFLCS
jgi:hypothetical protein